MANTAQRMEYVGGAAPTSLSGDLSDSGLQFNLADGTNYPTGTVGPFTLVINKGQPTEEIVLCDTRVNAQVNVNINGRGYSGTTRFTHSAGESVAVCWSASAADADNLHNASTSAVHGVAGNVVGDKDAQTLTNKVIDASKNTLSNVPQTAVTGLATSFAGKMANPATAWAKGSLLVGTGAGTYDTQASGSSGTVLTAQDDGSLAWQTPGSNTPLGVARSTVSGVTVSSSGGGATAIDSTGASVTFTAPASGKVLVRVQATAWSGSGNGAFLAALVHGSNTLVAGVRDSVGIPGSSGSTASRPSTDILVTGLTAGQKYTYDAAGGCDGVNGVTFSNALITVWAVS